MSMLGIRDMSVIETPPKDRLAIQTVVAHFDNNLIGNAIEQEMSRGGQVYFVHNRVDSIYVRAASILELVPNARIGVGHGQMGEEELERVLLGFMRHEYDVFVCTTIVENGLDIPLANTIIIENAERYGLSEMYQLRGRVGRSNRRAYAYLLVPADSELSEIARKRLAALREFSDLGAGFKIAALDLELRGAGNLLGGEQSGHIAGVGFDLYVRLVGEAVAAFRQQGGAGAGEEVEQLAEVRVELPVDAHVPHEYATGERLRLEVYRKIAEAADNNTLDAITEELTDRYGTPPQPVRNLIAVASFRQTCRRYGVAEVALTGSNVRLTPLDLPYSAQLRLRRLHPRSNYKVAAKTVVVPRPAAGSDGGGQRMGAAPMRDTELLDWCAKLISDLLPEPPAKTGAEAGAGLAPDSPR